MYISIGDRITLEEVNVFTAFHVAAQGDAAAVADAFNGRATLSQRSDHLWIDIAYVRELAGPVADDEAWTEQFNNMIAYATSQGWVDEAAGRVEAHIQREG